MKHIEESIVYVNKISMMFNPEKKSQITQQMLLKNQIIPVLMIGLDPRLRVIHIKKVLSIILANLSFNLSCPEELDFLSFLVKYTEFTLVANGKNMLGK